MSRNDSAFYTHHEDDEAIKEVGNYVIFRCGAMRVNYKRDDGEIVAVRTTSDLEGIGIDSDEKLAEAEKDIERFEWINNSWFEVVEKSELGEGYEHPVFHSLAEAIEFATNPAN